MSMVEPLPGNDVLIERLASIATRSADMAPALDAFVERFREIEADRFANNGPGWPPLADATIATKERYGWPTDQILYATGTLYDSLQGGDQSFLRMAPDVVEVGTSVPYAQYHQKGGTRRHASGAGWPPQRKIVDLTEDDAVEAALLVARWIFGGYGDE